MPLRLSRRSKYGAIKTTVDGLKFDSQAEARRYQELKLAWRAGIIKELRTQTVFPLMVNGEFVASYRADFEIVMPDGEVRIEDVKGMRTQVFAIKAKLFHALYGFAITEVR